MHQTHPKTLLSRREAVGLGLAAAAALPWTSLSAIAADPPAQGRTTTEDRSVTIGVATTGFGDRTNHQLAAELAQEGVHTVQLFLTQSDSNFWRYNSRNDVSSLTPDRCRAIADEYQSAGIAIHSIGVYTNLIHPDEAERNANLAYFGDMMKIARAMDVRTLITEAGHYNSGKGDLDYLKFVTLAASQAPNAPLILEYVGSQDYKAALAHLRGTLAKAGLRER